jgi:hypothetical protein
MSFIIYFWFIAAFLLNLYSLFVLLVIRSKDPQPLQLWLFTVLFTIYSAIIFLFLPLYIFRSPQLFTRRIAKGYFKVKQSISY